MTSLIEKALNGNRHALARLLSHVEDGGEQASDVLAEIYPHTGHGYLIGITGSPGTGKSSLVTEIAKAYRRRKHTVGIVAVDPTSPFSGGAILGDRIRMRDLAGDPGVFIRSMATRGSLGGLARATGDAVKVLDAAGYQVILIETVGAGQSEIDIARMADTTLVIESPGMGDDIQAIKAGIMEIADVLVVNKADRDGAENTARALQAMLDLGVTNHTVNHHGVLMKASGARQANPHEPGPPVWRPPVLKTIALDGQGIEEVVQAIEQHRQFLTANNARTHRLRQRLGVEMEAILRDALLQRLQQRLPAGEMDAVVERVMERQLDPYTAALELIQRAEL